MQLVIREINKNDIPEFYATFQKLVMHEFPDYSVKVRAFLSNNKRGINEVTLNYLLDTKAIVLGAYADTKLVGILIADCPYLGVSFCTWVIVDSEHQRKGIGKLLLHKWEEISKEKGAHSLRLETVKRNASFYKKMGYILLGIDEKGYCGVDKYLYKKQLQEVNESMMTNE